MLLLLLLLFFLGGGEEGEGVTAFPNIKFPTSGAKLAQREGGGVVESGIFS